MLPGSTFYEFFAGGGMARAGLQSVGMTCLFANDFDAKKVESYIANWGPGEIRHGDVRNLKVEALPGKADLIWASFPCQDLSLAGGGAGLKGDRSGTFWPFWSLVEGLISEGRRPKLVVLENVCGTLSSHGGKDFAAICDSLAGAEYVYGAIVADAAHFLPQSRPRVFFIAMDPSQCDAVALSAESPHPSWHTNALLKAVDGLSANTRAKWSWWALPKPPKRNKDLNGVLDESAAWNSPEDTERLLQMMAPRHQQKIETVKRSGQRVIGTLYRRTRPTASGGVQRAEVRFDGLAGCLRTPAGGSSRQTLMIVQNGTVKSRLLSAREAARLMGLDDKYKLPTRYNEAYHLLGDGVAVDVVKYIAEKLLLPSLGAKQKLVA